MKCKLNANCLVSLQSRNKRHICICALSIVTQLALSHSAPAQIPSAPSLFHLLNCHSIRSLSGIKLLRKFLVRVALSDVATHANVLIRQVLSATLTPARVRSLSLPTLLSYAFA